MQNDYISEFERKLKLGLEVNEGVIGAHVSASIDAIDMVVQDHLTTGERKKVRHILTSSLQGLIERQREEIEKLGIAIIHSGTYVNRDKVLALSSLTLKK